jgi:N-methylhydantoinase B
MDAITFSVLVSRIDSIATEMTIALENAAMTSILGLCRDYSCCIYDVGLRQVAAVDAIPIHTNSMHLLLREVAEAFEGDIAQGDVIACNYAYSGNSHIGDLVTVCPVFVAGRQMFWAAAKGHQLDVGAPEPISANAWARDVFQEGLQIPPVKLYDRGVPRRDVINLYLTNVRWREALEGDLMAMLGAIRTGERRLVELCEAYGPATIERFVDEVIDYAAQRTAAEIRAMPNGVYEAEGWLDGDGAGHADMPVRCTVTVADDTVAVDFAGSAPQVPAGVNASYAVMQAAGGIPVMMALDPDIPHNEGCLRRVQVTAPAGSICNAEYPAATATATTEPGDVMQDVVCRALAQVIPERVHAGTAHWANIPMLSGVDGRTGRPWGHLFLNDGGGGGAALGVDGWPMITTPCAYGGLKTASVEETELLYPVRFLEWEVEPDSMGLGEQIGGPGVRCTIAPVGAPMELLLKNDAHHNPPFGLLHGTAGRGGGHYIEEASGRRRFLPVATHVTLHEDQSWTGVSTGGGGYGDPLRRDPDRVRLDVRRGLYSPATAEAVCGVVLSHAPSYEVDRAATETAREVLRRARRHTAQPLAVPDRPGAGSWIADTLRPGDEAPPPREQQ